MAQLTWDNTGERKYETGVDHGVLYLPDEHGVYDDGVAWNGLINVTQTPTGAEPNPQYADNIKYLNLFSAEEFGATIEAFTYPDEFAQFDGLAAVKPGVTIGQQPRRSFGLSYRTMVGNDIDGNDHGYKLHLVYGCMASPSEKAYATISDTPEPITFSWEISTTPVSVTGYNPTALLEIDSTVVDAGDLAALEAILYGGPGVEPALPLPDAVAAIFNASIAVVAPITEPTINSGTNVITIPSHTGVDYRIGNVIQPAGPTSAVSANTLVVATLKPGYKWPAAPFDKDWLMVYTP